MNTDTTDRAVLLALVAAAATVEALALLLRPLVAHGLALLLAVAGWHPSPPRPAPGARQVGGEATPDHPRPLTTATAPEAPRAQLEGLPVRELRVLARAAGHRALARCGRRAQLLEVLA